MFDLYRYVIFYNTFANNSFKVMSKNKAIFSLRNSYKW